MRVLNFEQFKGIYRMEDEASYLKYGRIVDLVKNKYSDLSDFLDDEGSNLAKSVKIRDVQRAMEKTKGDRLSKNFTKFSELAVDDPAYTSVDNLDSFLSETKSLPSELKQRLILLTTYLSGHRDANKINRSKREQMHNNMVSKFFNEEKMTVADAKKVVDLDCKFFFLAIDNEIIAAVADSN
jgi:hypothetical protein